MPGFRCRTCGEYHEEPPLAFGSDAPHAWAATPPEALGEQSELTSDVCVLQGRYFFLRGCLDLPVHGSDQVFRWLVWVNVSEEDFLRTDDLWNEPGREAEPPYPGWLDSALPGYPQTLGLEVRLHTRPVGERPQVVIASTDHPLHDEQTHGLSAQCVQSRVEQLMHPAQRVDAGHPSENHGSNCDLFCTQALGSRL